MTDADTTVPTAPPALRVSSQDYLWFVRRAVVGMQQIVTDLGDDLACTAPALAGANSRGDGLLGRRPSRRSPGRA